jgi:hypothetical protein
MGIEGQVLGLRCQVSGRAHKRDPQKKLFLPDHFLLISQSGRAGNDLMFTGSYPYPPPPSVSGIIQLAIIFGLGL